MPDNLEMFDVTDASDLLDTSDVSTGINNTWISMKVEKYQLVHLVR